jgi:Guanylate kinase
MKQNNLLVLVSGCSGSGKTTIMRNVMDNEIISFTTRSPRQGEIDGKDYIFISENQFQQYLINNELIEHTQYGGNFYGLLKSEIDYKLSLGNAFAIVDYNGVKQLKKLYDNVLTIFIYTDKEYAIYNMQNRGDSDEFIRKRMETYDEEITNLLYYDEVVTNYPNELEQAIEDVKNIISYYNSEENDEEENWN